MNCRILILILMLSCVVPVARAIDAGMARIDVTPSEPIRLTGYGGRKTNSIGIEQRLWAKALAIGADRDGPALLITLDNCGIAESTYRTLVSRLTKQTRLKQSGIVIACSHTHSGPCTTDWAPNIFAADIPPEQQRVIDEYTSGLIGKLEKVGLGALRDRRPALLSWAQGEVAFARNRRVVVGKTAAFGDNAAGPVDHALPVLRVTDPQGKLRALVANYACHCTTLGGEFNHVCGDWAGYAQEAIEREQPGVTALITIGCGADANPHPRGGVDGGLALARQHGAELGAEMKRLLGLGFTPLTGKVTTQLREIRLPFGPQFTHEQWQARATNSGIEGYHARKWLKRIDSGGKTPESIYYPISTWRFGDDLAMVFLPGEVVVDYALRLKREFDPARLWVSSYSHYVPCYIPSRRILAEGGYEAETSLWYYDRPARISTNAEDLILKTVHELLPKQFLYDKRKAEFPDPKTPREALGSFRTKADFTVELVASEPMIESPVAIDWDAQGRLWVCEMFDYPTGIDPPADTGRKWGENPPARTGGYKPGGRIKVLESTRHDGHYDKATLFLDGLSFPTGVMPWRKGALICAAPDILYAEDTDGDGRADVVRTNFTGFATHNFQARVNGFRWGLDGWLHGSSGLFGGKVRSLLTGKTVDLGGRDFRIRADTGEIEPLAGVSQMGRVRDDFDNWFGNDNSTLLWHYPLPDHYLRRNPHVSYPDPRVNVSQASAAPRKNGAAKFAGEPPGQAYDPGRIFPASHTLDRFNSPESANRVTSACGIDIYRDVLLGTNYYGNAFICEPVHNLVTRLVLEPDGVTYTGRRAADETHSEFLASTDNWFRPVQVRTGPDGALWVVDMYRFVIEHPRWIAPERLKEMDVRAGAGKGRIYRVYPKGAKLRQFPKGAGLSGSDDLSQLGSPNGPQRDLAALQFRNRVSTGQHPDFPLLPAISWTPGERAGLGFLARSNTLAACRAQALTLLAEGNALVAVDLSERMRDPDPFVRRLLVRALEPVTALQFQGRRLLPQLELLNASHLGQDADPCVRFQFALSLGSSGGSNIAVALAETWAGNDSWTRAAVLSSAFRCPAELLEVLLSKPDSNLSVHVVAQLVQTALGTDDPALIRLLRTVSRVDAAAPRFAPLPVAVVGSFLDAAAKRKAGWRDYLVRAGDERELVGQLEQFIKTARHSLVVESEDWVLGKSITEQSQPLLRFLGGEPAWIEEDVQRVSRWLAFPSGLQNRDLFVGTLGRLRTASVASNVLSCWPQYLPAVRQPLITLLLSREEWTTALMEGLSKGTVAITEIQLPDRQRLLKHPDSTIRKDAARLFQPAPPAVRAAAMAKYQSLERLTGHPASGALLFEKNCAPCHAFRGHGHAVGPNLAEYAGKSVPDFVLAILEPNAAINPNFVAYHVETRDGRSLTGLVRGETASGLKLLQAGGVEEEILRNDLKELRASPLSLMPEGLEQALTPQELADLIAWLKEGTPAALGTARSR
ncbi:MAG: hypothetical protein QOF48_439 [Verrucomicrobiota bacterium]|jgi:putative membrane-bound dehydrogenase-like protein